MSRSGDSSLLYSLWTIQDSLLQYYRTMFITAESLVLAVAAAIASTAFVPVVVLAAIGMALVFVWTRVTGARSRDVSFVQELIKWHEADRVVRSPLATFKDYQTQWGRTGTCLVTFADKTTAEFERDTIWPPRDCKPHEFWKWNARVHLEVALPAVYVLCWIALIWFSATRPSVLVA